MSSGPKWKSEQLARNVHRVSFDFKRRSDVAHVLLRSDAHHDNPHSNHELERKHLAEAMDMNAPVISNGDDFCAMQGKFDPRSSKHDIRPENMKGDYLDSLVKTYAEFLKPFAPSLCVFGTGNHETNVLRRMETNLTTRLVERIKTLTGETIHEAGYTSWVIFQARRSGGKSKKARQSCSSIKLWRTHGYGSGGGFNQGTTQAAKNSLMVPDAQCIVQGHTHNEWVMNLQRLRLSNRGRVFQDTQTVVQLPSYKDEIVDGYSGVKSSNWAIERGMPPKPVGAVWMKLYMDRDTLKFSLERAQ